MDNSEETGTECKVNDLTGYKDFYRNKVYIALQSTVFLELKSTVDIINVELIIEIVNFGIQGKLLS